MAVSCVTDAVVSHEQKEIPFKIHENSIELQLETKWKKKSELNRDLHRHFC